MSATAAATAVIAQRNKIIRRFKEAGATAPDRPIDPATHQIHQSMIFNKLVREGVLVKVAAHHFYLNEERAAAYRTQQQQVVLVVLVVVVIAIAVILFLRWL
jgi:hypothetical protein